MQEHLPEGYSKWSQNSRLCSTRRFVDWCFLAVVCFCREYYNEISGDISSTSQSKYCLQFEFCFSPKSDLMNYHFICVIKTWEWKGNIQRSKIIKVTPTLHTCDLCGFIYCICCSSSLSQIPPLPLAIHWFTGTNRCYPLKTISFHSLPPAPT